MSSLFMSAIALGCFTYSASVTVMLPEATSANAAAARVAELVGEVAEQFGMGSSARDLEAMTRAALDEGSGYRPVAVYRSTERSATHSKRRILLVLQEHRSERSLRIIIRDLGLAEVSDFTSSLERAIVNQLEAEGALGAVAVERGSVGSSIYAP